MPSTSKLPKDLSIVSLKRAGHRFELACHTNKLHEWRLEKEEDPEKVLATDLIFADYLRGQLASDSSVLKAFETEDRPTIYKFILKNASQSDTKINDKRNTNAKEAKLLSDIVEDITWRTINTKTKEKFDSKEIEKALVKYKFDLEKFKTDKEATNPMHLKAGHHERSDRTRQAINFLKQNLPELDYEQSTYEIFLYRSGASTMLQKIERYFREVIEVKRSMGDIIVKAVINEMDYPELVAVLFDYKRSSNNRLKYLRSN